MASEVAVSEVANGVASLELENAPAHSCCHGGPGYATPLEAMSGPRETILYVTAVYTGKAEFLSRLEKFWTELFR